MTCTAHHILFGRPNPVECDGRGMKHVMGRGVYRVSGAKPEGNRPPGKPRRRWDNNMKMHFRKWDGVGGMDWIDLAQDRNRWRAIVNVAMNFRVA